MATNPYVNKVVYGDETVMDISDTTAEEANVSSGEVFYKASGARSVGTADYYSPSDTAETTIDDADYFPYYDTSATAKRKSLWSNIKSVLKTYFVSLFVIEKTKVQYDALPSADKNDPDKVYYVPDYEDTSKTWVRLDDSTTANDKVWSSSKIATELGGVAEIDDTTTSATKAWSSNKIQTVINSKLAYSENDTTGTVIDDADFVPYYDYSESARQKITFANIKAKLKTYFDSLYAAISHTHTASQVSGLATVATSGSYNDLSNKPTIPAAQIQSDWDQTTTTALDYIKNKPTIPAAQVNADWNASSGVAQILNKPTIPAAQVNSDWNASSGVAQILNKPSLATVATTGDYDDLTDKPDVDKVKQAQGDSESSYYPLLLSDVAKSDTSDHTGYAKKSAKISFRPSTCTMQINDGTKDWYLPDNLVYTYAETLGINKSAGDTIYLPSSGTDAHITTNKVVLPVASPNSDGTPFKFRSLKVYNGYVEIVIGQSISSSDPRAVGIVVTN